MSRVNKWFQEVLTEIRLGGEIRDGRNGKIISLFNPKSFIFNLSNGQFPKINIKGCSFKKTLLEGMYFISGENDVKTMPECLSKTWWKPWAGGRDYGKFYGYQLRHKEGYFDQLGYIVDLIKNEPTSRRIALTLWNPADINDTVLPACHSSFIQFYVSQKRYLDMYFYQRSGDMLLGVPHNIMWAGILNILVANECGLVPRTVEYKLGDAHVYGVHEKALNTLVEFNLSSEVDDRITYEILPEYRGLNMEELLSRAEQSCLNSSDRWALPIQLSKHNFQFLKLRNLELIA